MVNGSPVVAVFVVVVVVFVLFFQRNLAILNYGTPTFLRRWLWDSDIQTPSEKLKRT